MLPGSELALLQRQRFGAVYEEHAKAALRSSSADARLKLEGLVAGVGRAVNNLMDPRLKLTRDQVVEINGMLDEMENIWKEAQRRLRRRPKIG
jgi:hypothetical protein